MLTSGQIQELREGVCLAQRRPFRGPYRWARCVDGPLANLQVRIGPEICGRSDAVFGWCQQTVTGLLVANYSPTAKDGEWRFRGFARPGCRESGSIAPDHPPAKGGVETSMQARPRFRCRWAFDKAIG